MTLKDYIHLVYMVYELPYCLNTFCEFNVLRGFLVHSLALITFSAKFIFDKIEHAATSTASLAALVYPW
jgi:hypothetical protein